MKRWILTLATLGVAFTASAAELADVTVPDTAMVDGQTLMLNGMGLREKFWVDVYVGALYLTEKTHSADAAIHTKGPSRMIMHFVHDAPAEKIMDAWIEGFEGNNSKQVYDALHDRIMQFNQFFKTDTKDGDVMVFDMVPGKGTTVSINDKVMGTIDGDDFATALRAVWVGRKPPTDDLKEGLLGRD